MENQTTDIEEFIFELITEDLFQQSNATAIETTPFPVRNVSPKWERILILVYSLFILIVGTVANCLVLFLTARHQKFHEAYMYIRAAYAVVDICFAWGTVPIVLANLFLGDLFPTWISCYMSDIGVGMFLCTVYLTALIALERYVYFCHPLKYHRFFNFTTIALTCTAIVVLTQAYMIGTEIIYGRTMQFVFLMCQLHDPFHNIIQVAVWYFPSIFSVIFSIVNIQRMIAKMANTQVMPAGQGTMEPQLRKRASRNAIRLILLVSGAFWLTCLPIYIYRAIILSMGYTWDQLNAYDFPLLSASLRVGQFSSALSVVLDPLIYFWVNPDLRKAFRKTIGGADTSISNWTN